MCECVSVSACACVYVNAVCVIHYRWARCLDVAWQGAHLYPRVWAGWWASVPTSPREPAEVLGSGCLQETDRRPAAQQWKTTSLSGASYGKKNKNPKKCARTPLYTLWSSDAAQLVCKLPSNVELWFKYNISFYSLKEKCNKSQSSNCFLRSWSEPWWRSMAYN